MSAILSPDTNPDTNLLTYTELRWVSEYLADQSKEIVHKRSDSEDVVRIHPGSDDLESYLVFLLYHDSFVLVLVAFRIWGMGED